MAKIRSVLCALDFRQELQERAHAPWESVLGLCPARRLKAHFMHKIRKNAPAFYRTGAFV